MLSTKTRAVPLRPAPRLGSRGAGVAVFTALDGALLDPQTLEPGASGAAVRRLQKAGVRVVPVSVMTLEEIDPVARALGLRDPMVIEAGGAIARWSGAGWQVEPCGPAADAFLDVVREIEDRSGARLLVYSVMPEEEATLLSGRPRGMIAASTRRFFSEPFVIEEGDPAAVGAAAAALGYVVRRGPKMLHLCRACDRGQAFLRIREELGCPVTIGVGGSPVDAEFLGRADVGVIVPRDDGVADPELVALVPQARIAARPGPSGWAIGVTDAWQSVTTKRLRRSAC